MRPLLVALLLASLLAGLWSPQIQAADPPWPFVPDEVVVQYRDGTTDAQQQQARARVSATRKSTLRAQANGVTSLEVLRLPAGANVQAAIATLQADPAVEYAEPNWIYSYGPVLTATPNDPEYVGDHHWGVYGEQPEPNCLVSGKCVNQYGSQANEAWRAGQTGSTAVYVGVIDTGIQYSHEDLGSVHGTDTYCNDIPAAALDGNVGNPNEIPCNNSDDDGNGYVDDAYGWNFAACGPGSNGNQHVYVPGDDESHGTHVSGTIGAMTNNELGFAGINWSVRIVSGKFFGSGACNATLEAATRAVDYFTDLKLRGLNIVATSNSWGCYCYSQTLYNAISRANDAGILFIAAAGNDSRNNDGNAFYPAIYKLSNVISVAAIDEFGRLASFSNFGRRSVHLGAPGVGIGSTVQNGYAYWSGTSMATPHVTGAAALYAAWYRSVAGGTWPTASETRDALLNAARYQRTSSLANKTITNGRLDISCLQAKRGTTTFNLTSTCVQSR